MLHFRKSEDGLSWLERRVMRVRMKRSVLFIKKLTLHGAVRFDKYEIWKLNVFILLLRTEITNF